MKLPLLGTLTEVTDYSGGDQKDWKSAPVAVPFYNNAKSEFVVIESSETTDFEAKVITALHGLFVVDEAVKARVAVELFKQMRFFMDSIGYEFTAPQPASSKRISWDTDHEHERRQVMSKLYQIDLKTITEPNQVWDVVHPFEMFVSTVEDTDQNDVYVQAHLKAVWDDEHGIEFVLKNGTELVYVGEPVWPLTDYELDAYKK